MTSDIFADNRVPAVTLRIRQAMDACRSEILDQEVVSGSPELDQWMYMLRDPTAGSRTATIDVPINQVVGGQHRNWQASSSNESAATAQREPTYRNAMRLVGFDWGDDCIDYFQGALEGKSFPGSRSRREMELEQLGNGGPAIVVCGAQRAIGAVCWLVATQGDQAVLRKVKTTTHAINKTLASEICRRLRHGTTIKLCNRPSERGAYILLFTNPRGKPVCAIARAGQASLDFDSNESDVFVVQKENDTPRPYLAALGRSLGMDVSQFASRANVKRRFSFLRR